MFHMTWTCPQCAHVNNDTIDANLGPFHTTTCDECGSAFDQDAVLPRCYEDVEP